MSFTFSTAAPLPATVRAEGKLARERISATLDVASLDLRVLNAILKSPIISFTSGVASGKLSVAGPVNDPDYVGSLEVIGGGILCRSYSPDEAGPISTRFVFDGRGFRSDPVVATVGSARMAAQASFTIDHWVPVTFDISLATVGDSAAHLAAKFGSLNVDGRGVGSARIVGGQQRTDITGSLVVSDCRITLGAVPRRRVQGRGSADLCAVLRGDGTARRVLLAVRRLPRGAHHRGAGGKAAVTYRGDTGAYTVTGGADVHGGEIFFFDRSFVLKQGSIAFQEDQRSFDPRITARAEIREWDPAIGEEVQDLARRGRHAEPVLAAVQLRPRAARAGHLRPARRAVHPAGGGTGGALVRGHALQRSPQPVRAAASFRAAGARAARPRHVLRAHAGDPEHRRREGARVRGAESS